MHASYKKSAGYNRMSPEEATPTRIFRADYQLTAVFVHTNFPIFHLSHPLLVLLAVLLHRLTDPGFGTK